MTKQNNTTELNNKGDKMKIITLEKQIEIVERLLDRVGEKRIDASKEILEAKNGKNIAEGKYGVLTFNKKNGIIESVYYNFFIDYEFYIYDNEGWKEAQEQQETKEQQ